jgi:hypothetical protein
VSHRPNTGSFEPCLVPVGVAIEVPTGIARLLASEAAHAEDLDRLPIHEEED